MTDASGSPGIVAGNGADAHGSGTDAAYAIELRGITKRFGAVVANREIDLAVRRGTVHGIVGENGAGKSTLMSILYGFYQADEGEVLIGGKRADIRGSRDAIDAGIGMVHQHFMLVDTFSVLENVMLGAEEHALIAPSAEDARRELERLADEYGLSVRLDAPVGELPVGEQQRTEILKALYRQAEILILDEPTGVLTPQEADQLFRVLDALRSRGVTVILITHKLREIMDTTDTVSVLRHGQMVAHRETADTSMGELAELMVGRKLESRNWHRDVPLAAIGEAGTANDGGSPAAGDVADGQDRPGDDSADASEHVSARISGDGAASASGSGAAAGTGAANALGIEVERLGLRDEHGTARLSDISLKVRRGEILGVAGVAGNGQSELLEVLSGIRAPTSGRFVVNGREVTPETPQGPAEMRLARVNHVPEDRLKLGLVKAFTAAESSVLGYQRTETFNLRGLLQLSTIRRACRKLMDGFDVRPTNPDLKSASFSGGNQQKLILAREIEKAPEVLLVGQPTRGVDIGAIELIHERLVAMRDAGCAVLLVSVELDEIMALSDRIIVMYEGRIVGEITGHDADKTTLGLMMANAHEGAEGDGGQPASVEPREAMGGERHDQGDRDGRSGAVGAAKDGAPSSGRAGGGYASAVEPEGDALGRKATMSDHERGETRMSVATASVPLPAWLEVVVIPILNIAVALFFAGLIMLAIGVDPIEATGIMINGALGYDYAIGYTLYYTTNFIFTGLAVAVAFHASLFNIGGGRAGLHRRGSGSGWSFSPRHRPPRLGAADVPSSSRSASPRPVSSAPPGPSSRPWLQAYRGSHIVITTIMFNFIAASLMVYLLVNVLIQPGQMSPESREFAEAAWLPFMHEFLALFGGERDANALEPLAVLRPRLLRVRLGLRLAHPLGLRAAHRGLQRPRRRLRGHPSEEGDHRGDVHLRGAPPASSPSTRSWACTTGCC